MSTPSLSSNNNNISLHIIAQPAAPRQPKPQSKKSNNRYEKRRRKGQRVRQEKEQLRRHQEEQQQEAVAAVAKNIVVEQEEQNQKINDQDDAGSTSSDNNDVDDADDAEDTDREVEPLSEEAQLQPIESSLPFQKSTASFPNDVEARARYLAEYHARPLELDRRAHARRTYQPSHSSNHLFEMDDDDTRDRDSSSINKSCGWNSLVAVSLPRLKQWVSEQHECPTRIQSRAIKAFLASANKNSHYMIHSETGSGKTLAYLLPIIQNLLKGNTNNNENKTVGDRSQFGTRCLIICPTRDLARQTFATAEAMGRAVGLVAGCLLGDERRKSEKARIRKGLAIIVATPGRLLDHLQRTESLLLHLKQKATSLMQQWLVLDEADRLLDMGLGAVVQQIVQRLQANSASHATQQQWRTVLCSATVTPQVQNLAEDTLVGNHSQSPVTWIRIDGGSARDTQREAEAEAEDTSTTGAVAAERKKQNQGDDPVSDETTHLESDGKNTIKDLADSTPRQLVQLHMTVSAKLRLPGLAAFLAQHATQRTVVFFSTCAAVDYYHQLFTACDCILDDKNETNHGGGLLGHHCPIYKLHGSVPHGERQRVLQQFTSPALSTKEECVDSALSPRRGSVLLCTDVAARGLNLPSVDWIVQWDPPADVTDYVHRAGRVARAGAGGHALLFLLPSERGFLDVLEQRGVRDLSALSLTALLEAAAKLCPQLTHEGKVRSGGGFGGKSGSSNSSSSSSRAGEAFAAAIQYRLEECVAQDDIRAKKRHAEQKQLQPNRKRRKDAADAVSGELVESARKAFLSYVRAYPTREKTIRHVFAAKALHLGHVARSFALKEPPKKLAAGPPGSNKKKQKADNGDEVETTKRNKRLAFDLDTLERVVTKAAPSKKLKESNKRSSSGRSDKAEAALFGSANPAKARSLLMANAAKLQSNGLDAL